MTNEINEILTKISNDVLDYVKENENFYNENLSIVKKMFLTSSQREKNIQDIHSEIMNSLKEELSDSIELQYLISLKEDFHPEILKNSLLSVIESIEKKGAIENSWLEEEIKKNNMKKVIDLDFSDYQNNLEKGFEGFNTLISCMVKLYCAELTNRINVKYENMEVNKLGKYVSDLGVFQDFRSASISLFKIPNHQYLKPNDFFIEEQIKKCCEKINLNIDISKISIIKKTAFDKFIKDILEERLTENFLQDFIVNDWIKIKKYSFDYKDLIYPNYLKKILDKRDLLKVAEKELYEQVMSKEGLKNFNLEEISKLIDNIKRVYESLSKEEIQKEYNEIFFNNFNKEKEICEKFILLSASLADNDMRENLLNNLNDDDLQKIINRSWWDQELKRFKEFWYEIDIIKEISKNILKERYSEEQINKFKNGEDNLNLIVEKSINVKVDVDVLNSLFKYKIDFSGVTSIINEKFILKGNKKSFSLILFGEYTQSLKQEECLELLMFVVKNKFIQKEYTNISIENIIHEKELKYELSLEENNKIRNNKIKI